MKPLSDYALMLFQDVGRQAPGSIVIVRQKARVCGAFEAFLSVSPDFLPQSVEHLKINFIGSRVFRLQVKQARIGR